MLWNYYDRSTTERLSGTLMADVAPDWKDDQGRSFPGYPDARSPPYNKSYPMTYAQCWNDAASIFVRSSDLCPCNRPGSQGGRQQSCCRAAPTMDLSYWAFERLAHPLYGDMTCVRLQRDATKRPC